MSRKSDKADARAEAAETEQAQADGLEAEAAEKATEAEMPAAEVEAPVFYPTGVPVAAHVPPTEVPADVQLHPVEGTPLFNAGSPTGKAS